MTDSAIVGVSFISQAGSFHFLGTSYSVTVRERRDGHEFWVLWEGESVQEITPAFQQHRGSRYEICSPDWVGDAT